MPQSTERGRTLPRASRRSASAGMLVRAAAGQIVRHPRGLPLIEFLQLDQRYPWRRGLGSAGETEALEPIARACPAGSGAPRNRRASDIPSCLRNEASKHRLRTSLHGSVSNCAQNCTRRFRKPCSAASPGRQPLYRTGRHLHADGSLPHLAFNARDSNAAPSTLTGAVCPYEHDRGLPRSVGVVNFRRRGGSYSIPSIEKFRKIWGFRLPMLEIWLESRDEISPSIASMRLIKSA